MTCRDFTIVDRRGRQRFHFTSTKPPILLAGAEVPATQRATPDSASYLVFNDDHGNERGGLIASVNRTSLSLDYSNCDALELFVDTTTEHSIAGLSVRTRPDPQLSPDQAWNGSAPAAQLGWSSEIGSCLMLHDSVGRPRIVLSIDANDRPHIQVLDEAGQILKDLAE